MDKDRLVKMAKACFMAVSKEDDGSYTLLPGTKQFADMIESAVSHDYEVARKKDQQDLTTLRQRVQSLAGENIKLRAAIVNARECLDEVSNG